MAQALLGEYTSFTLTEDEEVAATTFNVLQKMYLQNWRADLKKQLDNLPPDFDKPTEYFKQKIAYDAQIKVLTDLIELVPVGTDVPLES